MYTQCPDCLTIFSLDAPTVAQSRGTVSCGRCGATFDAIATLAEELPPQPSDDLPCHAASPSAPMLIMAVARTQPEEPPLSEDPDASGPPQPTPAFIRHNARARRPRHTLRWAFGCLCLAALLGAQLAWAKRDALIRNATTGPVLADVCRTLGCRLPVVPDLPQLHLISRDVRPHPSVPGALLISATLRNDARFAQPYPIVSITLSNLDDQRVAMRRFRPSEYIADKRVRAAGLAPGTDAALTFEVKDPGQDAVAFEFGFQRPPR